MAKEKEKRIARIFYVEQGKTAKEIADLVAVSETTLSKWVANGNWREERNARINRPALREANIRQVIADESERRLQLNRDLETATRSGETETASEIRKQIAKLDDGISKWNKVLIEVSNDKISLSDYLSVMDQIFQALRFFDAKLFIQLVPFQEQHVNDVAQKYR